jgi:hypothetical protein
MKIARLDRLKQLKRHHKILLFIAGILAIFFYGLFFVNKNYTFAQIPDPDTPISHNEINGCMEALLNDDINPTE